MKYDFDHTADHRRDRSIRWEQPKGEKDIIGMGTADMDFRCAPAIKEALQPICSENTYNYKYKSEAYYDAVIGFLKRKYGLQVKKSWLSNVPGTIAAVHLALDRFSKPGDAVLMQSPYFTPLKNGVTSSGRKFITNPLVLRNGHFEIDFRDFEAKIRKYHPAIFLLVNPQNPTGRVFNQEELEKTVDICYENHVKIISDEVHSLITRDGHQHIPILKVSERARKIAIQVFSFSKGYNIMDLPHAVVVIADPGLSKAWQDYIIPFSFDYTTNLFAVTAVTVIAQGKCDDWQEQLKDYLDDNLNYFMDKVKANNLPLKPIRPEAGFILWIDCRNSGLDLDHIGQQILDRAQISLNNGLEHGKDGRGFIRMNFAVTHKTMAEATKRLIRMFQK